MLDAVICDPPYGVRAGGRKVAPRPEIRVLEGRAHFPVTEPYLMGECLRDLLDSAARLLRLGGRLCFFIPASEETYDVSRVSFWRRPPGLHAQCGPEPAQADCSSGAICLPCPVTLCALTSLHHWSSPTSCVHFTGHLAAGLA